MRDREKRGLWGEMRGREKERGCGRWFRLQIIYSLFYFFRVMVEPVQFILVQSVSGI
jgi:hypothetical protein